MRLMKRILVFVVITGLLMVPAMAGANTIDLPGTPISNTEGGQFEALTPADRPITIGLSGLRDIAVGRSFEVTVTAESLDLDSGGQNYSKALFVVEITVGNRLATPDDIDIEAMGGDSLGYDADGGFFFWGPREGFAIDADHFDEEVVFIVMPLTPGTYGFDIVCVNLETADDQQ